MPPAGPARTKLAGRSASAFASRERFGEPDFTRSASEVWSGRRGSNPRPTAWKAVTLPLSYSRSPSLPRGLSARATAPPGHSIPNPSATGPPSRPCHRRLSTPSAAQRSDCWLAMSEAKPFGSLRSLKAPFDVGLPAESNGGEGRIRTSEATWATDLQSVAFDRSATSPHHEPMPSTWPFPARRRRGSRRRHGAPGVKSMELAEGFEPPTS